MSEEKQSRVSRMRRVVIVIEEEVPSSSDKDLQGGIGEACGDQSILRQIYEALQLKPNLFGFSVDLKRLFERILRPSKQSA